MYSNVTYRRINLYSAYVRGALQSYVMHRILHLRSYITSVIFTKRDEQDILRNVLKMPKVPVYANSKSLQYEREFPYKFRANPTGDLFCILCCQTVNCEKCFRVESHQSSAKHKKLFSTTVNTAEKRQQTFIPILKKNFKSKLVEAFLVADIPLFKLQHPQII